MSLAAITALFIVPTAAQANSPSSTTSNAAAVDLQMTMRVLWEEHITYTRNYIISALAGLPDSDAVAKRLLRNQDDIGNAIKPYYGDVAGQQLAALLRDHIRIATEVVKAARAGEKGRLAKAQAKWSKNGKDIAALLSSANPNWHRKSLETMLQRHLDLTTAEVAARLNKDWAADIKAYDDGHAHMLMFADMLADGIAKQFPGKFKRKK
jgi:phage terminase Nu1 subunit (DNA packaging protein)